MAGIVGSVYGLALYGATNPRLSTELDDLDEVVTDLAYYESRAFFNTEYNTYRVPASNRWGIVGNLLPSFKNDFYERIHLFPSRLDLGIVANTQQRQISVWNAYTKLPATLASVTVNNGPGIAVTGPVTPLVFQPLQEVFWTVVVTPDGPPLINANVVFNFDGVTDPLPLVITGSRAVVMPIAPEPPVQEKWAWLTDVHVAIDGTEQRIALREEPRRRLTSSFLFTSEDELREQYKILLSARGRLFIPYFQYSALLTAPASAGALSLAFNTGLADIRSGEYILAVEFDRVTLIPVDVVGEFSVSLLSPLSQALPKGTRIVGVFPSLLPNNLTLTRGAINTGMLDLQSDAIAPRSLVRPGNRVELTYMDGLPVLERRPLATGDIGHEFDTGQETGDAKTGLVDLTTDWDSTKVEQTYSFKANRVARNRCGWMTGTDEMDYWREFGSTVSGSLKPFLLSSYRPDQILAVPASAGASGLTFLGASYFDNFWPTAAYHYLALTTPAGVHYAKVTAASKNSGGNSTVSFAPSLPAGAGWEDIQLVSYLQKLRIADDAIKLDHWPLDTTVIIKTRTTPE